MSYFFVALRTICVQMDAAKGYSIAYKGLKNGSHDFSFKVGGAFFGAFGSVDIKDGECGVSVALVKSETQLSLDVSIHGGVLVACDRCLEDCRIPVDFEGRLLVRFSNEPQEYDGEVLWLAPGEDEVDLAQYIYESIVLSLPYQRVHPEGGCDPGMLRRFRIVSGEEFARIEARSGQETPKGGDWEKLAALREQLESEEHSGSK